MIRHPRNKAAQSRGLACAFRWSGALMIAWVCGAGSAAAGEDWPGFLGPNRDGRSAETGLRNEWPETGPEVLWRVPIGSGYSGVVAAGPKLYTLYAGDDGNDYLAAFTRDQGHEVWRASMGRSRRDPEGSGPRATPVADGERVCAFASNATLGCFDLDDGRALWFRDLREEMGARIPQWGVASSPVIEGSRLIVQVGARKGGAFAAFDKHNGAAHWTSGNARPAYASPIVVTIEGVRQAIFFTATDLVSVAVDDGRELWSVRWVTELDVHAATPIFVPSNGIMISSGYDTGAGLFQVRLEGDRFKVHPVWSNRLLRNHFNGSVRVGRYVYGFDESILKSLDVVTGQEQWRGRAGGKGSLIAADGKLLVLGGEGTLTLVRATHESFEKLASARVVKDRTWAPPTLSEGVLFIRSFEELVAVDLR